MAKGNAIFVKGKKITASGIINVEDMTLEIEEFSNAVSVFQLLEKQELDGKFVKITIEESDMPITQDDLEV